MSEQAKSYADILEEWVLAAEEFASRSPRVSGSYAKFMDITARTAVAVNFDNGTLLEELERISGITANRIRDVYQRLPLPERMERLKTEILEYSLLRTRGQFHKILAEGGYIEGLTRLAMKREVFTREALKQRYTGWSWSGRKQSGRKIVKLGGRVFRQIEARTAIQHFNI